MINHTGCNDTGRLGELISEEVWQLAKAHKQSVRDKSTARVRYIANGPPEDPRPGQLSGVHAFDRRTVRKPMSYCLGSAERQRVPVRIITIRSAQRCDQCKSHNPGCPPADVSFGRSKPHVMKERDDSVVAQSLV